MSEATKNVSFYLFSEPSFMEGLARIVDFGGSLRVYNIHETEAEADAKAISNDWKAVGLDIKEAVAQYERSGGGQ